MQPPKTEKHQIFKSPNQVFNTVAINKRASIESSECPKNFTKEERSCNLKRNSVDTVKKETTNSEKDNSNINIVDDDDDDCIIIDKKTKEELLKFFIIRIILVFMHVKHN